MSLGADRLYQLLPAVYRMRDEQQGRPLFELVSLIAREIEALEENAEQLYDDQFIETCQEWVAPYIGDLIGYRPLHGSTAAVASPRAEIANTIAYRRRKGTAAMLEQLARDVTDCPARAVEAFEQLATTQYMNHVRLHAPATANLRSPAQMFRVGGAFNSVAHTAEMRRPERGGRYNIANIAIFLWRLRPFQLSHIPLTPDREDTTGRRFRFNPLGADQPLFRKAESEKNISHIAEPVNVPEPINLRLMARDVRGANASGKTSMDDYGVGRSIDLVRISADPSVPPTPIPLNEIVVCDLRDTATGWAHEDLAWSEILAGKIAVDPQLGRVLFGSGFSGDILASHHYGFSRAIGGGEYERSVTGGVLTGTESMVAKGDILQPRLDAIAAGGRVLIADSYTYAGIASFSVDGVTGFGQPGNEVVVAANNGARPVLAVNGPVALNIGARGRLILEGLVISGGGLHLPAAGDGEQRELILRDCTLVPGWNLNGDGVGTSPGAVSILIEHPFASVRLERCIVGPIRVASSVTVVVTDTIIDATSSSNVAFAGVESGSPGGELTIAESTVIGKLHTYLLRRASNTVFLAELESGDTWPAPIVAERKQEGCVRFSYVPRGALVPRRFRCVPSDDAPDVVPQFTSLRYGQPGYAQVRSVTDRAIRHGADDAGEMGVMHALHQPQREANLRTRFDEYLRFGLHAGIFYIT